MYSVKMNGIIIKYSRNVLGGVNLRHISGSVVKKKEKSNSENYVPVYKFPYIRYFSIVNRLKLYQTILTATNIPAAAIMNQMNYIHDDALKVTCIVGLSGCITLYSLGFLTGKFIGFIYYDEERDMAKVAYIDFWGNRKDLEIPANDVVPIKDLPSSLWDKSFLTFRRYSTKKTLRLIMQYGVILDKNISKIL